VGRGYVYREVLDHVIILNERHLRRVLQSYLRYYYQWQTHLSLMMDCPHPRPTQRLGVGRVIAVPEVGGLHHHDERRAAS
jgi:putative transposase